MPNDDAIAESEITSLLRDRNELTIELTPGDPDQWLWQDLALEIRCRAFLRETRAVAHCVEDGWIIEVFVNVIRENPGDSLEVYALIDGANQDYRRVPTDDLAVGMQFKLPWKGKADDREVTVRVDLVNVSTIWHTAECLVKLGD